MAADVTLHPADGQARPSARPHSGWAIAALFCSMAVMCPVLTLIGPMLGLRALVHISANPNRTGRGMAWTAIVLGLTVTSGWITMAVWWNAHARPLMMFGPRDVFQAAEAADWAAVRSSFGSEADAASDQELQAFFTEVSRRYGRLIDSAQTPDAPALDAGAGSWARAVSYLLRFERDSVEGVAEIRIFTEGIKPRLGYVEIRDADAGNLVFPASAAARASQARPVTSPTTQPASQPQSPSPVR